MSTRSSRDGDVLGILGLELTTVGSGMGRIIGRSNAPDYEVLASECGHDPDSLTALTIGRLLGFDEERLDRAIQDGIREGYFRPAD